MAQPSARKAAPASGFDLSPASTGLVLVDKDMAVRDLNAAAASLLAVPNGAASLLSLFDYGEKSGLVAAGTGQNVLDLIRAGGPSLEFETGAGRRVLLSASRRDAGGWMLELTDVTSVLERAQTTRRDPLTGLPNRLDLLSRLSQALSAGTEANGQPALLYLDLDRFKFVNDTLGHPAGDLLLKRVAERMTKLLGEGDTLARIGGDEFALLRPACRTPGEIEQLAKSVIDLVSRPYLLGGSTANIGVSIGIAIAPADGRAPEELIKNADLALFKAKGEGRGTLRFFTGDLDRRMQARRAMEQDMRRALALEEFSLAFQPQLEVANRRLKGFEALLRWSHQTRGNVSPAEFIPLAEDTGLILPLGEWVLRTACREAATWPSPLTVSVNVSALQFRSPHFVGTVVSALASSGLEPSRLDIEITEGALIDNTETVVAMLNQLKSLGVKVSMDDFGTGYSSLSYLQKFPFDKIKIDQSFVRGIGSSTDSAAIVRAIAALGASLGMTTIAEGVETEDQLREIGQAGCQQVQGYHTGRPLGPEAAKDFIRNATNQ